MLKKLLITLIIFFTLSKAVSANEVPNNKFGIHMAQPHIEEIPKVADLVNGGGGDWGYVTLVMQENDRNRDKWQEVFDTLREYRLIPIIRLATVPEGENWRRPSRDDAGSWANFLNSLNWVVKKRYVVLFNEPNHGSEWGGEVDAKNYSEVATEFAQKLKEKNPDFFVMLAGLDASAPSYATTYMDEEEFLKETISNLAIEQFSNLFSGLASHSYPNPGFSASPYNFGRTSVHGYQWELGVLRDLGIKKDLPVFITETGWIHRQDQISNIKNQNGLSPETAANYFQTAYENVWLPDDRIVAVTPFVYDYQGPPFLGFSWKKFQSNDFYQVYYTVRDMAKQKGEPEIIDNGRLYVEYGPYQLVAESNYHFKIVLKNTGQAIWDHSYQLTITLRQSSGQANLQTNKLPFEYIFSDITEIKPFQEAVADLYIKTKTKSGQYRFNIELQKDKVKITSINDIGMEIVPLPSLEFEPTLFPKLSANGPGYEIQVFDEKEGLVFKRSGIGVRNGWGLIDAVQNITLGEKYRVVLLKAHYLPRQEHILFKRGNNILKFKRMYPLDLNRDGHFDWGDVGYLIQHPQLMGLLFP